MNTKDYQVVRLSKLTAQRIKLFNKGNSYDENINAFWITLIVLVLILGH